MSAGLYAHGMADDGGSAIWPGRLRWRLKGATLWPLFFLLTVVDAVLLMVLPIAGADGPELVGALLRPPEPAAEHPTQAPGDLRAHPERVGLEPGLVAVATALAEELELEPGLGRVVGVVVGERHGCRHGVELPVVSRFWPAQCRG